MHGDSDNSSLGVGDILFDEDVFQSQTGSQLVVRHDPIREPFVRSKADMSQLNLPHGTDN